ncbi:alpha/beta fold hydrolase [Myxosarcina sp. GI1(2024)]
MSFVFNNGIRIHYQVEGKGLPLVLQHGLSDSIESWYEFGYVERLKDKFQLITINARGHGKSDKPHDCEAYNLKLMAGDVVAVLDKLHLDRVYYAGNSLGCRIGFSIAKYAPKRIKAFVMGGHHPYLASRRFLRNIFQRGLDLWLEVIESATGTLTTSTRERFLDNDIDALRAVVANDLPDISDVLPSMIMGCRLFAGSKDAHYQNVKRASSQLLNGDFVPLFGLNHFQVYLRGDIVAPLIKTYINRVETGLLCTRTPTNP